MDPSCRLFDAIELVDADAWDKVCAESGAGIFMDRRFIAAVESGMRASCRFRYVIIADAEGRAVCCACLSTLVMDMVDMTEPAVAAFVRRLPAFMTAWTTVTILFCGLPVSAGQSNLAITPGCDRERILRTLDDLLVQLAVADKARIVSWKEFNERDIAGMDVLGRLGYSTFESPPMHRLRPAFGSLNEYCAALRSHYRKQILTSRRKLARGGVTVTVVTDADEMERIYTPQVHQLYLNVLHRSEMKVETLTDAFFRGLARHMGSDTRLIVLRRNHNVIGFSWHLQAGSHFCILFAGLSYELNAELDLYFNIMYASLDYAMGQGVSDIQVGQTADAFKARLGCEAERRFVFAKGVGPVMAWTFRHVLVGLIPRPEAVPTFRIYREHAG